MPDEQARTDRAREEATDKADMRAELKRHEERLLAINHSTEKTYAKIEIMMAKFEMIATMIQALGHRIDMTDGAFTSAQRTMNITALALDKRTEDERARANSSRDPWRFILLILAGAVGVGSFVYTIFSKG